jgi:ammonia channel protein AmtB
LIAALNIDDPLEAASVHYANGIWGLLSCFVFDSSKGFVSGNTSAMGPYVGVQIYGSICVTLWGIVMAFLYFAICSYFDWLRYHPLYEYVGAHRLKMGDITQKFLTEIRQNHRPSTADPLKFEETEGKLQLTGNSRVRVVPSQDNNA